MRLGANADTPAAQARIARVAEVLRDPGVASVVAYEPGGDRRLVSRDGRSTYVLATFKNDPAGARPRIEAALADLPWVTLGGGAIAAPAVGDQVAADIARAELIAFPLLFLLTLFVFRSAVSALLPLAVGATHDPADLPRHPGDQQRDQPDVDLRPEPGQRARAGAGDRLLAVHGQPLPRGAGRRAPIARRR